jgi:hypothetical protein
MDAQMTRKQQEGYRSLIETRGFWRPAVRLVVFPRRSRGLGGSQAPRRNPPKPQSKLSRMSQPLTIYRNPRPQAISYAIILARLAYDGKLAVNLI